ncbi:MAG: DUF6929 family protein [Solirubrobacterales bacterium]
MDRHRTAPEDLPPLELRPLRELDLAEPSASGRPAVLSAASGVVRRGVFAYVIGDDENSIGVFDLSGAEPGELRKVLSGELPADDAGRHEYKSDLEALTAMPPFGQNAHGGLLGLGSGSNENRDRGFWWSFGSDGSLAGEPVEIDLAPAYGLLRSELGEINIEGASVFGERLWLFHRGNKGDAPNTVAELDLDDVYESLEGDRTIDTAEIAALRSYELGEIDGTPLCFSDASPLFDRLVVFTASAEVDSDGDDDGEIRGSVVGTIDAEGVVQRLRAIDRKWKVEGVHAAIDTGVIDLVFVCDQDDSDAESPLLTATMPLEREFDQPDE